MWDIGALDWVANLWNNMRAIVAENEHNVKLIMVKTVAREKCTWKPTS